MKTRLLFVLMLTLVHQAGAQQVQRPIVSETIHDHFTGTFEANKARSMALKGPVKKVISTKVDSLSYGQSIHTESYEFDRKGSLIAHETATTDPSGEDYSIQKRFDYTSDGSLKSIQETRNTSNESNDVSYSQFNSAGYLEGIYRAENGKNPIVNYTYVKRKNKTIILKSPPSEFDIYGYSEGDTISFAYNAQGLCVETIQYYFFGEDVMTISYDATGKVVGLSSGLNYHGNSTSLEYDSLGRIISQRKYWHGINQIGDFAGSETIDYRYDTLGHLEEIHTKRSQRPSRFDLGIVYPSQEPTIGSVEIPEQGEKVFMRYDLDSHGNWIKCRYFNAQEILLYTEARTIEYFD